MSNSISFYYRLNKCFIFGKKKCLRSLKLHNLLLLFSFNKVTRTDKTRSQSKLEQEIIYATKPGSFTKSASFARMAGTSSVGAQCLCDRFPVLERNPNGIAFLVIYFEAVRGGKKSIRADRYSLEMTSSLKRTLN